MESKIPGVVLEDLTSYPDERGLLVELFRVDEISVCPVMGYVSWTIPWVSRGPHEHIAQTDVFLFLDGLYELHLWDNRVGSDEDKKRSHEVFNVGKANPTRVTIPPGVVHSYRNIGGARAMVLNFPDTLYKGWGKQEPVDEIRHEETKDSIFRME